MERFNDELEKTNEYCSKQSESLTGMLRPNGERLPPAYGSSSPSVYKNTYMVHGYSQTGPLPGNLASQPDPVSYGCMGAATPHNLREVAGRRIVRPWNPRY